MNIKTILVPNTLGGPDFKRYISSGPNVQFDSKGKDGQVRLIIACKDEQLANALLQLLNAVVVSVEVTVKPQ